jgi:hypothetical protein
MKLKVMERKFKVGDRVKVVSIANQWIRDERVFPKVKVGDTLEVELVSAGDDWGIWGIGGLRFKGLPYIHPASQFAPIDPPAQVLTEWQEGCIEEAINDYSKDDISMRGALDKIKFILSEPEPPQWEPKEGEVCLFRDRGGCWVADVFVRVSKEDGRHEGVTLLFDECRQFDIDLIGTTDNP